jgi:cation-transporting P-type ATPase E
MAEHLGALPAAPADPLGVYRTGDRGLPYPVRGTLAVFARPAAVSLAGMEGGLSEAEAQRRLAARDDGPAESGRSTASIVRANLVTPFNAILVALGVLTLSFADWRDALFLGIVVANSGIGIGQELRAKRKLERLAALVAPHAVVVRDGAEREVDVWEVVAGDLVRVAAGDQIVADGTLVATDELLLDESILTGESRPVARESGDEVRSGTFAIEGVGAFLVTAAGTDAYAERLAGTAREFRHPRSPLERQVNRLLYASAGAMLPLGAMLVVALERQEVGMRHAVETAVAGMVTLVPEGLVLLVSLTFAAAAVRLTRLGALVQQLNAIESLASVDTLCIDKTGTLTDATIRVVSVEPCAGVSRQDAESAFGRLAASLPSRNSTAEALAEAFGSDPEAALAAVPFSPRRRWSGVTLRDATFVLGAPELFDIGPLVETVRREQAAGRRVVAIGAAHGGFPNGPDLAPPPTTALGIAVLAESLRADAEDTIAFLAAEGVDVKVLSGDDPATVLSIARDVGIATDGALDGRTLPADDDELADLVRSAGVIGRIEPEGKRRVVEALTRKGRYVAMVGDGVNDVPALKAARLAIAQASGAQMARSVSDIVLVHGDFAAVPLMVAEGRRILRNIQRVAKLFVAKSVFAAFLILAIGLTPTEYPLLPRHLTVVAVLTVGTPAFFLALAPSEGPWRPERFLREVGRFSVPAGVAAGLGVIVAYLVTLNVFDLGLLQARTAATTTLIAVGLYLVLALEATGARRARWVGLLCATLFSVYILVLALPGLRAFFELGVPHLGTVVMAIVGSALAIGFLWLTDDRFVPLRSSATAPRTPR